MRINIPIGVQNYTLEYFILERVGDFSIKSSVTYCHKYILSSEYIEYIRVYKQIKL